MASRFVTAGHAFKGLATLLSIAGCCLAQTDPGPRGGSAGAGGGFSGLNATEQAFFTAALDRFKEVDSVSGNVPGEAGVGLGPTFNANSCAACHAQPAIGGTSPFINPQVAQATLHGAANTVPSFITLSGPVREARFISTDPTNVNAVLDGGVHGLFTIKGRSDAPGCNLAQPNFAQQLAAGNVSFRIPTPVFGLGLVEDTPDLALNANLAANASQKSALGIGGKFNTNGNDGTITRFGWKAQNKSLMIFAGEAYNVEQGVSNEVFPNERAAVAGCVFNNSPEDVTPLSVTGTPTSPASAFASDTVNFAAFMRLAAPPTPTTSTASQLNGKALFSSTGCALCHTPTLTTGNSQFTGMSNFAYHPYSDFAVHHMGSTLIDGVNQGGAGPDEFRTAPLWGIGQRIFFLHDGRASDLTQAIAAHFSSGNVCVTTQNFQQFSVNGGVSYFQPFTQTQSCGSEANGVISAFNALNTSQKQDILNFLRSL